MEGWLWSLGNSLLPFLPSSSAASEIYAPLLPGTHPLHHGALTTLPPLLTLDSAHLQQSSPF